MALRTIFELFYPLVEQEGSRPRELEEGRLGLASWTRAQQAKPLDMLRCEFFEVAIEQICSQH